MNHDNQPVIETRNLSKQFGSVKALSQVNLVVPRNSIFGFLGPNGAGKTTLMKVLLGLVRPSAGSATIFGMDIVKDSVAIHERIGYLPQQPRFIEYMSARDNLRFAASFFFSGPKEKIEDRCNEMMALVGLEDKSDRPIKGFSGGEKQRLGIALAQINYPDLLVLDEPASALDPLGRHEVLSVMERLRKYTTIFYSTHILDDVQRVSDTVAILNHGKMVTSGSIEQILSGKDGVIYDLEIKGSGESVAQRLQNLTWIRQIHSTALNGSSRLQISVQDEAAAENLLLRTVLEEPQVVVLGFQRKKFELEEVFMQIVKGENDER